MMVHNFGPIKLVPFKPPILSHDNEWSYIYKFAMVSSEPVSMIFSLDFGAEAFCIFFFHFIFLTANYGSIFCSRAIGASFDLSTANDDTRFSQQLIVG